MLLYQQVAARLADQIQQGSLKASDKLPSLRQLSRQLCVSIGTIQQAYALLEDQQLIAPKNKSGFYVCNQSSVPLPCPQSSEPECQPAEVSILETTMAVIRAATRDDLIPLGSAHPNYKFPAIKQLHKLLAKHAQYISPHYEDPQGYYPLRQQIARRAITAGTGFSADEVLITSGCQQALSLALRCVTQPGDIIAIESPCFYGTLQTIEAMGIKTLEIATDPQTGIHIPHLKSLLEQWPVKAILLNSSFNNPLGYSYADEKKQAIVDLLESYDIPLIEDDIGGDLAYSGSRPRSIYSFDKNGRVLLCSSVSKTLVPDLRVGWLLPGRYFKQAFKLKFVTTMSSPRLQQAALAEFLSNGRYERHLRSVTKAYAKRQCFLLEQIHRFFPAGTKATQPQGGFLSWIELPEPIDSMTLYRQALAAGISITPGELFSPGNRYQHFIRLNYAIAEPEQMTYAIKKLATLMENQ